MERQEHLELAKCSALELVDKGQLTQAVAFMVISLETHPQLKCSSTQAVLGMMNIIHGPKISKSCITD